MSFANRQFEDVFGFVEVSKSPSFTPGAVGNGSTVASSQACTTGGVPATFTLTDQLEVYPPLGAATNGLIVTASPGPTPGTAFLYFQNATGGSITPVAGVYTIVATRVRPDVV